MAMVHTNIVRDGLNSRIGDIDAMNSYTTNDISYHRHCQATILSAYGTLNHSGETWDNISELVGQLSFLGDNWIDYFKNNTNITQDFSAILHLINKVSSDVSDISDGIIRTINITDQYGNMLDGYPHMPSNDGIINQKIGRRINLLIDGQTISFDTIVGNGFDDSSEITEIEIPRHILSFKSGNVELGAVNVVMEKDQIINIPSQFLPLSGGTVTGDTTFNAKVTLKDSPSSNAYNHEVVDASWVKNKYSEIFDLIYPIGSIYISIGNMPPSYGTWEQLSAGITLWNVEPGQSSGQLIEAGLPNIEGSFDIAEYYNSTDQSIGSYPNSDPRGSFQITSNYTESGNQRQIQVTSDESVHPPRHVGFSASKYNSIYGKSDTVQPPSIGVTMWKRTE